MTIVVVLVVLVCSARGGFDVDACVAADAVTDRLRSVWCSDLTKLEEGTAAFAPQKSVHTLCIAHPTVRFGENTSFPVSAFCVG